MSKNNNTHKVLEESDFCDPNTADDDDNDDETDYAYNINEKNNTKNDINKTLMKMLFWRLLEKYLILILCQNLVYCVYYVTFLLS